jgi:hypothetical protein
MKKVIYFYFDVNQYKFEINQIPFYFNFTFEYDNKDIELNYSFYDDNDNIYIFDLEYNIFENNFLIDEIIEILNTDNFSNETIKINNIDFIERQIEDYKIYLSTDKKLLYIYKNKFEIAEFCIEDLNTFIKNTTLIIKENYKKFIEIYNTIILELTNKLNKILNEINKNKIVE